MSTAHSVEDALGDLIPRQMSSGERADMWGERFMKLTLFFVFIDIAFFATFMLAESNIIPVGKISKLIEFWTYPAAATVGSLGATCVAGLFKLSHVIGR